MSGEVFEGGHIVRRTTRTLKQPERFIDTVASETGFYGPGGGVASSSAASSGAAFQQDLLDLDKAAAIGLATGRKPRCVKNGKGADFHQDTGLCELVDPITEEDKKLRLVVDSSVLSAIMDHSYSDPLNEIVGHLGGTYHPTLNILHIQHCLPSSRTISELRPDSVTGSSEDQVQAFESFSKHDVSFSGWYHSHPRIKPFPSHKDLGMQEEVQFSLGSHAVGIICSPFFNEGTSTQTCYFNAFRRGVDPTTGEEVGLKIPMAIRNEVCKPITFYEAKMRQLDVSILEMEMTSEYLAEQAKLKDKKRVAKRMQTKAEMMKQEEVDDDDGSHFDEAIKREREWNAAKIRERFYSDFLEKSLKPFAAAVRDDERAVEESLQAKRELIAELEVECAALEGMTVEEWRRTFGEQRAQEVEAEVQIKRSNKLQESEIASLQFLNTVSAASIAAANGKGKKGAAASSAAAEVDQEGGGEKLEEGEEQWHHEEEGGQSSKRPRRQESKSSSSASSSSAANPITNYFPPDGDVQEIRPKPGSKMPKTSRKKVAMAAMDAIPRVLVDDTAANAWIERKHQGLNNELVAVSDLAVSEYVLRKNDYAVVKRASFASDDSSIKPSDQAPVIVKIESMEISPDGSGSIIATVIPQQIGAEFPEEGYEHLQEDKQLVPYQDMAFVQIRIFPQDVLNPRLRVLHISDNPDENKLDPDVFFVADK